MKIKILIMLLIFTASGFAKSAEVDFKNLKYQYDFDPYIELIQLKDGKAVDDKKITFIKKIFKFNKDDFCVLLNLEKNGDNFPFFAIVNNKLGNPQIFLEKNIKIKSIEITEDSKYTVVFAVNSNIGTSFYKLDKITQIISQKLEACLLNSSVLDTTKISLAYVKVFDSFNSVQMKKNSPVWYYQQRGGNPPTSAVDWCENIKIYFADSPMIVISYIQDYKKFLQQPDSKWLEDNLDVLNKMMVESTNEKQNSPNFYLPNLYFVAPEYSSQESIYKAKLKYLKFKNFKGIRYLTNYTPQFYPVINSMEYVFQGITNDGKYYITMNFVLDSTVGKYVLKWDRDNKYYDVWHKQYFYDGCDIFDVQDAYLKKAVDELNSFDDDSDFSPSLNMLDYLISSVINL